MSDEESARKAILARRARFVAAALVGSGVVSCERVPPEPCLSVALTPSSAGPQPPPAPCLSVPMPTAPDAGPPDAGPGDAGGDAAAPPMPCLSPPPPPPTSLPRICLSRPIQKPKPTG